MKVARVTEMVLGAWLFISAFLWPHYLPHMVNTWVVGATIVTLSFVAMRVDWVRYLNVGVAGWLALFTLVSGSAEAATMWNNTLVALVVGGLSFLGRERIGRQTAVPA